MTLIPNGLVQCVVTSPPYWGLRKYAGEQELVWGDNHCEHEWASREYLMHSGRGDCQKSGKYSAQEPIPDMPHSDNTCSLCGAWRGAYGLEPTPEMYVQHTVEILREIRRVLRKDGVVFWNISDSYAGNREKATESATAICGNTIKDVCAKFNKVSGGLKPKDLCLIPFRVAIAAQTDGWWVRSVIIWSKPNPMPESVTDRPTESHEYILMLTKSARYYWDADAVREPLSPETMPRIMRGVSNSHKNINGAPGQTPHSMSQPRKHGEGYAAINPTGRNIRSVWEFPTQPFPTYKVNGKEIDHFAVFPEALPKNCIMAATKEGDTVLDPFAGRGTVGVVSKELNRNAILIDISEEYCALARKCIEAVPLPMKL